VRNHVTKAWRLQQWVKWEEKGLDGLYDKLLRLHLRYILLRAADRYVYA